jgi:hypothetical protein
MRLARAVVGRSPGFDTADLQEAQALLEVLA